MLLQYINSAMKTAIYEKLEDGTYFGQISDCPGVLAFHPTLFGCQEELRSALEGWLLVKLRHGDLIPVIENIDLNQKAAVHE
jgi:predicted RNase H-like HicB family nuclease